MRATADGGPTAYGMANKVGTNAVTGSIVLMHFEADVDAFTAQARRNGLRPALLTDHLV